jgi:hypothetical protein
MSGVTPLLFSMSTFAPFSRHRATTVALSYIVAQYYARAAIRACQSSHREVAASSQAELGLDGPERAGKGGGGARELTSGV